MNIPNLLTSFRILLVPGFIYVFFSKSDGNVINATYIFILAGITDILDGYIARKYDKITQWGQVMDPLADKLMQLTVLICFTIKDYLPMWIIFIIGIKEILLIMGGLFLYYKRNKIVIPANKYGKIATIAFYIAIIYMVFDLPFKIIPIIIALILTLMAFWNYLLKFKVFREKSGNNEA